MILVRHRGDDGDGDPRADVVLRAAAAFGTHGRALIDISFAPLLQAAFLAGRDVGQWEAGRPRRTEAVRSF